MTKRLHRQGISAATTLNSELLLSRTSRNSQRFVVRCWERMQEKRAQRAPGIVWGCMRWLMWAGACLQGEQWKKTTLTTALLYPGVVFAIFFACNLLVWGQKSSGAGASSKRRLF